MVIKYIAPVKGVPFCTQTTATQTVKIIEHSKNRLIIEGESITDDAPYCDTFTCQEVWIALDVPNSPTEKMIFVRLMYINFIKRNFFKNIVETKAYEGLIENAERWLIIAKNLGIFAQKAPL